MYEAANAEKIVAALRETEAESEATRRLSDRAVELLHRSGVTRIVSPAAYGGYELPVRALVEAERIVAQGSAEQIAADGALAQAYLGDGAHASPPAPPAQPAEDEEVAA